MLVVHGRVRSSNLLTVIAFNDDFTKRWILSVGRPLSKIEHLIGMNYEDFVNHPLSKEIGSEWRISEFTKDSTSIQYLIPYGEKSVHIVDYNILFDSNTIIEDILT